MSGSMVRESREGTDFCSGVAVVIGVCFVFGNLVGVLGADAALRHLFANAGIQLAHLGSLAHSVACLEEILSGLDSPASGRGPYGEGLERSIGATTIHQRLLLRLSVVQKSLGHLLGILHSDV